MSLWEELEEALRRVKMNLTGRETAQMAMPNLEEAAYRINALRAGDPVSERGEGMGLNTPGAEDYMTGALDAITPLPVGAGTMLVRNAAETLPLQVGTRMPSTKEALAQTPEHDLIISLGAMQEDPRVWARTRELLTEGQYPQLRNATPEELVDLETENLLWLYNQVPEEIRSQTKRWYDGANVLADEASRRYGVPIENTAGVYAALSPQKDWYQNVSLGDRLMAIATEGGEWTPAMQAKVGKISKNLNDKKSIASLNRIQGKNYDELDDLHDRALWIRFRDEAENSPEYPAITPEGDRVGLMLTDKGKPAKTAWGGTGTIAKALDIFENPGDLDRISRDLGNKHKVRSFYNNIITPWSARGDTTIDTHAIGAGLLTPYSGEGGPVKHNFGSNVKGTPGPASSAPVGVSGTYGLHHEAYERAAQEAGILPREMQSITWEAIRGLFPKNLKNDESLARTLNVWDEYNRGLINIDQARQQIHDMWGGIRNPTWMD